MKTAANRICAALLTVCCSLPAAALDLSELSNKEASSGLKEALNKGAASAVSALGQENGFLGNPKVKIPLPPTLAKAESTMKMLGLGKQADELVTSMNRAAEAAVPEAKTLLLNAVKNMSVSDAKGILTGGDNAATDYFRKTTSVAMTEKFLPIVTQATAKVGLAKTYDGVMSKAAALGVSSAKDGDIEHYVTARALDGVYTMIGEKEKEIREHPLEQGSKLLGQVFGSLVH